MKNDNPITNKRMTALLTRVNGILFQAKMTDKQCEGIERYVYCWWLLKNNNYYVPISYLAYVLATVYHETAKTMQPVEEYGKGAGHDYGVPDPITGQIYYGRGDVQVTWKHNYQTLSQELLNTSEMIKGVDIVNNPDLLLNPIYSAQAAIIGMSKGIFTGRKLNDYLDQLEPDYINARRIINGTDRAVDISQYAKEFEKALLCEFGEPISRDTLYLGANSLDIFELQLLLNVEPDGDFGSTTNSAVVHYQKSKGLIADGMCGKDTWRNLQQDYYW